MDKKEMQNWIDYLNNGGDALDMMNELEKREESTRKERESLRLTLKEGGIGIEDVPVKYRDAEMYTIAFSNAEDVFQKRSIAKLMDSDIDELADNGKIRETEQLENLKRAIFGTVTMQEESGPEVELKSEFENADVSEKEAPDEFDDSFGDYDDEENGTCSDFGKYPHPEDCRKRDTICEDAHCESDDGFDACDADFDSYEDFSQQILVDGKKQDEELKNTQKDDGEVEEIKPNLKKVIAIAMAFAGIVILFKKRKRK